MGRSRTPAALWAIGVLVLLTAADIARFFFTAKYDVSITDGFETAVVLFGALACVVAATRSTELPKGLWATTGLYFAATALGDGHDFLIDLGLHPPVLLAITEFAGWGSYLPLLFLVFFPQTQGLTRRRRWMAILDFAQVTIALALLYFRFVYLPHAASGVSWTRAGTPELVRNLLISIGLVARASLDPSHQARAVYRRVSAAFVVITASRLISGAISSVARPAALLALGLTAWLWDGGPATQPLSQRGLSRTRLVLSVSAAANLIVVVLLASGAPETYRSAMYAVAFLSTALYVGRAVLAESTRFATEQELRASEANYAASEALLREFVRHTPAAVAMFDRDMRYLQISDRWLNDYHLEERSIIGRSHYDVFPDIPERWKAIHQNALAGSVERCDEDAFPRADGSRDWLQWEIRPWLTPAGDIGGVIMFTQVITQRKQAEERLLDSENRFRTLTEHSLAGIYIVQNGVFCYANPAMERITGMPPGGLIGVDPLMLLHPEDRPLAVEQLRRRTVDETAVSHYEARGQRPDGTVVWYEILGSRTTLNGRSALIGTCMDVTARKLAQESLRKSEHHFRTLIDGAPVAVALSRDGKILYINKKYRDLFGFGPVEDLVGRPVSEGWAPEMREMIVERARLRSAGAPVPSQYEMDAIRNGARVPVHVAVETVDLPEGRVAIAFLTDMTERKRAEREQRLLEEQFRQAQKMDAVGRLAGGVAHDFNNLLAVILGYSEMLLDEMAPDATSRGEMTEIQKAAERAADLTRQLLAFSRRQVLQPRVRDLNEIVTGMEKMLRRLLGEDVILTTHLAAERVRAFVDTGQMEQVIMNLAVNARDAMPGGGTLRIDTGRAVVGQGESGSVGVPAGTYATVVVSDTGIGMSAAVRERIFEPFYTTKEVGRGTGLGLSTVLGIVEQSGGHITLETEPGTGTTFHLWLPEAGAAASVAEPEAISGDRLRGTETILLVEDDEAVRKLAATILTRNGYRVIEAADGAGALAVCAASAASIDLLLTDMVMPSMSGAEVARQVRAVRADIRVACMSGHPDLPNGGGAVPAESVFIIKPFTTDTLLRGVRVALAAGG